MNNLVSRICRTLVEGFFAVLELVLGLMGILGGSAVVYGWSLHGSLDKGVEFFIQEFNRFFASNSGTPLLQGLGNIFTKYVNVLSEYPWAHIAVFVIGLILIVRGRNRKRFVGSMKELISATSREESSKVTKLQGKVIPGGSNQAMAKASRKIGFGEREEVDTTGMPSVLARHANWGLKKKS